MLYRKKLKDIEKWYKESNKALLIDGARQVGKTKVIEYFLESNNIDYLGIDLIKNEDALEIFNTSKSCDQLLLRLSGISNKRLIPGKTVIYIDEIQQANDAITLLKYCVLDGRYRFIVSGSLLGIKLKDIKSIPVGYMQIINMYPLDFEEFMVANGVTDKIFNYIKDCFINLKTVDTSVHKQLLDLFKTYLIVGGMPEAVQKFIDTKNLGDVKDVHNEIDVLYLKDITQYNKKDKLLIDDIYNLIPSELNNQNKRFIIKNLNEKARYSKYESSFVWIKDSGVGLFTYNVDNLKYPLLESKERSLFKLFLCDIGLLCSKLYGENIISILNRDVDINYGAVYESVVAQELIAHGYPLYYYNNKKKGEVDFAIEVGSDVVPIEVKSGKDYKRHSALNNILKDNKTIKYAYIFNNDNFIKKDDKKIYLPIYMIMFINNSALNRDMIYSPDISLLTK